MLPRAQTLMFQLGAVYQNNGNHSRLLANVKDVGGKQLDEEGNGTGGDDNLSVVGSSRRNVCRQGDHEWKFVYELVRAQAASNWR